MLIKKKNFIPYTAVSNTFIDRYMPEANGEFVKVYLYLLRITQSQAESESGLALLADRLNCTENDVLRALRYWEKLGLLSLTLSGGNIQAVELSEGFMTSEAEQRPYGSMMSSAAKLPQMDTGKMEGAQLSHPAIYETAAAAQLTQPAAVAQLTQPATAAQLTQPATAAQLTQPAATGSAAAAQLTQPAAAGSAKAAQFTQPAAAGSAAAAQLTQPAAAGSAAAAQLTQPAAAGSAAAAQLTQPAAAAPGAEAKKPARIYVSEEALNAVQNDMDFKQVLFVAETYLGRTLSAKDIQLFAYLYDELHFSEDLLEYLVEYCVGGGHRSNRYMESVALGWHEEGITSVGEAKEMHRAYSKESKEIMQAMGISGRVLTRDERRMTEYWLKELGMSLSLVVEACGRTMSAIHQPSFEYTGKILESWHKEGISTVEEARAYALNRKNARKAAAADAAAKSQASRNRFQNYQGRDMDYDALLSQGGLNPYQN